MTYIRELLGGLAKEMRRDKKEMQGFIRAFQAHWFDSKQAVQQMTINDYDKLQIPRRLATMIMEKVGATQSKDLQGTRMDIEESVHSYIQQLKQKNSAGVFNASIDTLMRVFRNIRDHVASEKYRLLKKSNQKIAELVSVRENWKILKYGGFEEIGDVYIMQNVNLNRIDECLDALLKYHEGSKFDPFQATTIGKVNTNYQGQTSVVYNDKLEELEQYRHSIMSKPLKDRQLRVFQEKKGELKPDASWNDNRDASLQEKQYAEELKERLKNFMEDPKFMNRRKKEYFELAKKPIFSQTVIRVKMPDNWIFECKFSPMETLGDLVRVFDELVIDRKLNYYLYMTPPVQKLTGKILKQSFYDKECVPRAIFYFGCDSPIKGSILKAQQSGNFFSLFK